MGIFFGNDIDYVIMVEIIFVSVKQFIDDGVVFDFFFQKSKKLSSFILVMFFGIFSCIFFLIVIKIEMILFLLFNGIIDLYILQLCLEFFIIFDVLVFINVLVNLMSFV